MEYEAQETDELETEDAPSEEEEVNEEFDGDDAEGDAEGISEDGEDESSDVGDVTEEEVEYEGNKYKVPAELKEALLRQSDYTRKTQEVAEQRKSIEAQQAEFQQAQQVQQENIQSYAQLAAVKAQLEQYANVDWQAYTQDDAQEAQQAFFQYTQLKDAAGTLESQVKQKEAESINAQRERFAAAIEKGKAELARDIPGWSEEKAKQIMNHGKEYGLTDSELSTVTDPRMVKILNDAYLYRQSLKSATKPKAKTAEPVKKIQSGKTRAKVNPDKLSTKEWLKWRNKQVNS